MADLFLEMKNISKKYAGVQALENVDFTLERGEIHCLVGQNGSGKSTLVKIISGVIKADPGSLIKIEGHEIHHASSINTIHHGIAVIYQDPSLFPTLSVAENIAFSRLVFENRLFINYKKILNVAKDAMEKINIHIPLDMKVEELSMADQQLVAICRALTSDVRLIIMDEPTTALTKKEVDSLFKVVMELKDKAISTLFISHKLDEVFRIAQRVTVLRDGKKIGTFLSAELDEEKLSMLMTGKNIEYQILHKVNDSAKPLLEIQHLSKKNKYHDLSMTLKAGEIIGLTGLLGSGRTEFALSLFGLNKPDSGDIKIDGKSVFISSVNDAIKLGIAYVPENRLTQGLFIGQPVSKNILITIVRKCLNPLGFIDLKTQQQEVSFWVKELNIKVPTYESAIETLSGGNQQKVVLAKWLATKPKILILDGPTVGIDIAAKSAMHAIIKDLANKGVGVIIISDEVNEVYHNSNRVLLMRNGRFVREFSAEKHTAQDIVQALN